MRPDDRYSVLIADDNRDAADSLAIFLELRGYAVRVVYTGPAAVLAALTDPPDCAIIDIGMPGLDGCAVARKLRGNPVTAKVKLIAYSGYTEADLGPVIFAAGFDCQAVKGRTDPADIERLLAAFRGVLPDSEGLPAEGVS